jgi:hypothetical protein
VIPGKHRFTVTQCTQPEYVVGSQCSHNRTKSLELVILYNTKSDRYFSHVHTSDIDIVIVPSSNALSICSEVARLPLGSDMILSLNAINRPFVTFLHLGLESKVHISDIILSRRLSLVMYDI